MRRHFPGMRNGLFAIWFFAGLAIAACGDDGPGGAPAADAGTDGIVTPPAPTAAANASDIFVYTRTLARLDATTSEGSTYTWTLKSAPPGSAVTTDSIESATTARPSFVPDVSGEYLLDLAVGNEGVTSTREVRVTAVPAPIFYMLSNIKERPPYAEYRVVGADGTGGHPVACRIQPEFPDAGPDSGDDGDGTAFLGILPFFLADFGMDWWEAPPGQPSRAAFQKFLFADGGIGGGRLAVATQDSTCQSPGADIRVIDTTRADGGDNNQPLIIHPHFSPDGRRIAYIEQRPSGHFVSIAGYDGQDYRVIAPFCEPNDSGASGCWSRSLFPARPQWIDAQTIAWVRTPASALESADGDGWVLVTAKDSATPNPQIYMTCSGYVPFGFAMLADGTVLANRTVPDGGTQDLEILRPVTPGGPCEVVRNLTNFTLNSSYARDFDLSPDRSQVAFIHYAPDAGVDAGSITLGGEIYVAPTNGASPAVPITDPPQFAIYGPRYIAEGSLLAFNGMKPYADGGPDGAGELFDAEVPEDVDASEFGVGDVSGALNVFRRGLPAIVVVPAQGGPITYAAESNLDNQTLVIGGGNGGACGFTGCDFGGGGCGGGGTEGCNGGGGGESCNGEQTSRKALGGSWAGVVALAYAARRRKRNERDDRES